MNTNNKTRIAYIGLGSNLGDPRLQCNKALGMMRFSEVRIVKLSSFYSSPALLLPNQAPQPDYINAVIKVRTTLGPEALLAYLLDIESRMGRVRTEIWGSRLIDLDLLLYGKLKVDTPKLALPHPQMLKRAFVVVPLLEIAPRLMLPNGYSLKKYRQSITSQSLKKAA